MPKMTEVGSSTIHSHGYDPRTRKLTVRFKTKHGAPGDTWEYDEVPAEKAEAFAGTFSHGSFFQRKIKPHHAGRKVG